MLGAAQLMADFQGIHFNIKKALYINFQKHASIFHKAMICTINGGGHDWCYVFPTSVCDNIKRFGEENLKPGGISNEPVLNNHINI